MKKVFWVTGFLLLLLIGGGFLFAKSIDEILSQIDRYRTQQEERLMRIRNYHFIWQQGYIKHGNLQIPLTSAIKDSIKKEIKDYIKLIKVDIDSCKMWLDSLSVKIK